MQYLRYNTDSQEVTFGIFVDSTDGNTEETGLTIANTDIHIWKAGATTLVNKNSGGATHISNGVYYAVFDSTDTNTLGSGKAFVHISGALYQVLDFCVLPQKVYDSMIAGSDNLEVDAIQIEGTDATDQINSACDTAISDAGVTTTRMGYVDYLANATYGLSAIETLVDEIESRLTATRAGYLDELGSANIPADIDTLLSRLTALRAGYIDNLSGGAVALASGVTVSDKTGFSLSSAGVTAVQSGLSTLTAQQVWEYATRTLSSFGTLVSDITSAVWGATTRTLSAFGFNVTASSVTDKTGYSLSESGITAVQSGLSTFDPSSDTVAHVTLVDTCTENTDMRGTNDAYTGTPPTVEQIQSGLATSTEISSLNDITVSDILSGETETGLTLKHAIQIMTALALKASGGGTTSISFRDYGDTKNRLTMTVDENGNRTNIIVNLD